MNAAKRALLVVWVLLLSPIIVVMAAGALIVVRLSKLVLSLLPQGRA
ncbi:MAG: hypothetical protein NTY77_13545 [Elusimicrobia bacterium]|nr:hypothetical protein [Elusimicrobiota bacterium]